MKESDVLSWLVEHAKRADCPTGIVEGIPEQNDAAVMEVPQGHRLVATSDFVRGTEFYLYENHHLTLFDIGWYLVGANLSDLAAMGAKPLALLSILRYRNETSMQDIAQMFEGISAACSTFQCPLVGGDTGTYSNDVLAATALGTLEAGKELSRSGCRAGDLLVVSGEIGGAAASIALNSFLEKRVDAGDASELSPVLANDFTEQLYRWRRVQPRLKLGQLLAARSLATSCMDVSDGLSASVIQLSKSSQCGFLVDLQSLPIARGVRRICEFIGKPFLDVACGASVDFELLFTISPADQKELAALEEELSLPLTVIGEATTREAVGSVNDDGSQSEGLPGIPWDHQVANVSELFDRKK